MTALILKLQRSSGLTKTEIAKKLVANAGKTLSDKYPSNFVLYFERAAKSLRIEDLEVFAECFGVSPEHIISEKLETISGKDFLALSRKDRADYLKFLETKK